MFYTFFNKKKTKKQTNKKFQIFYLKHELTSFEEIQSGDFINNLTSFLSRTSRNINCSLGLLSMFLKTNNQEISNFLLKA